jgi:hypothetical protein
VSLPNLDAIQPLLDYGADATVRSFGSGWSLLHGTTCHNLPLRIIDSLLRAGAPINATCEQGRTILHDAVGAKYHKSAPLPVIQFLLSKGADPSIRSHDSKDRDGFDVKGVDCFELVSSRGNKELLAELRRWQVRKSATFAREASRLDQTDLPEESEIDADLKAMVFETFAQVDEEIARVRVLALEANADFMMDLIDCDGVSPQDFVNQDAVKSGVAKLGFKPSAVKTDAFHEDPVGDSKTEELQRRTAAFDQIRTLVIALRKGMIKHNATTGEWGVEAEEGSFVPILG